MLGYANDGDIAGLWENKPAKQTNVFTITVPEGIVLRGGQPSLSAPIYGVWSKGDAFRYDSVFVEDGFVWLGGSDSQGTRIFIPVGENDGNPSNVWGIGY